VVFDVDAGVEFSVVVHGSLLLERLELGVVEVGVLDRGAGDGT